MAKLKNKIKRTLKKRAAISSLCLLLIFAFSSFGTLHSQAQNRISGTVIDVNGMPLLGVNVIQKGTSNGTVTDFDGNYELNLVSGTRTIVFSYVGYLTKEIPVESQTQISVTLEEDAEALDEVVVIGYTPVSRKNVLGSLSTVKSESLEQAAPVSALDAAQGKIAGVQILSNGGPGDGFDIRIRGVSTFGGAGTSPLYVVDGQQLDDIDNLNPDDIASFEVVKDGATAAIYGAQAANGVVIITTKRAKAGELQVNINSITGYNQLVGDLRVSNTRQRERYDRLKVNGTSAGGNSIERDTLSQLRRYSYDLQELVTRPAIRNQTNVGIQGGSEKAKFYWNTGYTNEEGIAIRSDYKRLTSMLKLDVDVSDKFSAGAKMNLTYDEQNGLNESQVFQQIVERIPYYPVFEPNGSYSPEFGGRANPIAETLATQKTRNYRGQLFSYAQLEILPNLTAKSTFGINYRFNKLNIFNPIITQNPNNPVPNGRERFINNYNLQQENFINYKNTWDNHTLGAFAGMQIQRNSAELFDVSGDFSNEYIESFNNVDPLNLAIGNGTENSANSLFSLFSGFNYDYKNKYLLSGTFRRDGSSRFGKNNKYGNFPSLSVGWKINQESFFEEVDAINNLMLSATYGVVGNDRISNYEFTGAFGAGYVYNGVGGIVPIRLGNEELKWEETASTNLGLDLGMFRNRLILNVDLWKKETTDLLALVPLPEESGFSSIRKNVGAIDNKGIDISLSGTILKTKDFSWNSSFNISYQENEVTQLEGGTPFESGFYKIEEGEPIGNIFGFENLGVYQYDESNAYTDDGVQLTPNFDDSGEFVNYTLNGSEFTGEVNQIKFGNRILEGGDIIWEDIDGDFSITESDRQIIGNGLAKYFGGFTSDFKYKNFSFGFLLDYSFGQDIYRRWDEARNDLNSNGETPGPDRIENAWVEPGDVTVYPRLNRVPQNRYAPNSFFVTKGDYIKLRYVRLNYDFPKEFINNTKFLKSMSLNLAVNNVLTWTDYIGFNPELGNRGNPLNPGLDTLRYPNDREIVLGLKIQM